MKKSVLVALMLVGVLLVGCVSLVDPETGETLYGVAPAAAGAIDATAEGVETVGPGLAAIIGAINPGAGVIAGVAISALTTLGVLWRKWRTPMVEMSDSYDRLAMGARAAGDVIEEVVKPNAELWDKARPMMRAARAAGATNPDTL